jgi:probable HAF family extracellular repeat protein
VHLAAYPGGDTKARHGYAFGANQSVQVVGYVQNTLFGQRGAFWDNDASHTLTLLEPPAGHWTSLALAVNDLGQAVGQSHPPYRTRAVLWLDDAAHTPVELGTLPGDVDSTATGINNAGQIIGASISSDGRSRPVLWQDGRMLEVGSLLDATGADWEISSVTAVNNLGHMVGTGLHHGQVRTFLMTPAGR